MFYNIEIHQEFRDNYRILYNFKSTQAEPKVYRFKRMIMGTNDSPCLAISTIHLHLENIAKEKPHLRKTCELLKKHLYVDDFIISVDTEKEAITWLCSAVIFCCICMSVPIVHLVPLLTDAEFTIEFATSVLMVLMFCGAFGRILGGKLGDMIGALPAYLLMSLGQTISVIWFPYVTNPMGLYLLAAFFGFTYSGVMSSILVCTRMMVSAKFAGRANSLGSFFGWTGMGIGGFLGGYFFDLYGDYFWSFAFASLMGAINLLVLLRFLARINNRKVVTQ